MSTLYSKSCQSVHAGDPYAIIREIRMQVRELMTQGPRLPHQIVLGAKQWHALCHYLTDESFPFESVPRPKYAKYEGLEIVVLPMSGIFVV